MSNNIKGVYVVSKTAVENERRRIVNVATQKILEDQSSDNILSTLSLDIARETVKGG